MARTHLLMLAATAALTAACDGGAGDVDGALPDAMAASDGDPAPTDAAPDGAGDAAPDAEAGDATPDMGADDMGRAPDGTVEPDVGPQPDAAPDMAVTVCGDGVVDAGEACDLGPDNGAGLGCSAECAREGECGDGVLQPAFEECDEGDTSPGGFCDAECGAIEQIDPLGYPTWPEGARVVITQDYEMGGAQRVEAGAVVTLEGNWPLTGDLTLHGRPRVPVVVRPRAESRCGSFLFDLDGHTLVAEHAILEGGRNGVLGRSGRLEMRDVVIRDLCSDDSASISGIRLSEAASAVIERVRMEDFTARVGGAAGPAEDGAQAAADGVAAGAVTGLSFTGDGELRIDDLSIAGLTAGPGGAGGDGVDGPAGDGGAGGSAYGLLLSRDSRVRDVRIGALRAGAGGPGGDAGFGGPGVGGEGGEAVGISTEFARPAMASPTIERVEISGLWSGAGGPGGQGRQGRPGEVGGEGGEGGLHGRVRGIFHDDDGQLQLNNALIYGLHLGSTGPGGRGGDGGPGEEGRPPADGGRGGSAGPSWEDPLVGVEFAGPIEVNHATVVIDDQPEARPAPAPGGMPGPGGAAGAEGPVDGIVRLFGVLARQGNRGPVLNSIVVGDGLDAPGWHETTGLVGSANDLEVEDTLIWGFDEPISAVEALHIVQAAPGFVDRAGGDLRPAADSPAVGQGTASAVTVDLRGVERPDPPTLGALEPAPAAP